ncbi:MAG TPA: hypothetical protein VMT30_08975 [Candidatus Saccharimonadia bacterium]|nr:hypothetical protein [Candidatus Saccharimonadia bacterium]
MRRLWAIGLVGLAVVLQLSILPALRPLGVVPNLALVGLTLVALQVVTSEALALAVLGGVILDLASGANFGLWTGIFMLVALASGMLHRAGIELEQVPVALVMVGMGTILIALVIWIGLARGTGHWSLGTWGGRLVVELVINLTLTILLRPVVRMLVGGERQAESGG